MKKRGAFLEALDLDAGGPPDPEDRGRKFVGTYRGEPVWAEPVVAELIDGLVAERDELRERLDRP